METQLKQEKAEFEASSFSQLRNSAFLSSIACAGMLAVLGFSGCSRQPGPQQSAPGQASEEVTAAFDAPSIDAAKDQPAEQADPKTFSQNNEGFQYPVSGGPFADKLLLNNNVLYFYRGLGAGRFGDPVKIAAISGPVNGYRVDLLQDDTNAPAQVRLVLFVHVSANLSKGYHHYTFVGTDGAPPYFGNVEAVEGIEGR